MMHLIDERGRIVEVTDGWLETLGYRRDEVLGKESIAFLTKDSRRFVQEEAMPAFRKSGRANNVPLQFVTKDGEVIDVLLSSVTDQDERGAALCSHAVLIDVTELRRAERALRQSEELRNTMVESAPDPTLAVSAAGRITMANSAVTELFGYEPDELIGKRVESLIPKCHRQARLARFKSFLANPTRRALGGDLGLTGLRSDGSEIPIDISLSPIQTGEGLRVIAAVRDMTERRREKEALRKSEEKYRTLFQLASDAILTVTPDGAILDANVAATELLGYTREEIIGLTGSDQIVAPEEFEETDRAWREQLGRQGHFLTETVWLRKDGSRVPVAVSGKPIEVQQELQFKLVARDLTERNRAKQALLRASNALVGAVERPFQGSNSYRLTIRQLTVLHHVAEGLGDKEIAAQLGISPLTVHKHVAHILAKMEASSRTEAGVRAQREGLLE